MLYLVFLGGVVLGTILTRIYMDWRSGSGYFSIVPYRDNDTTIDDGFYRVNVSLRKGDNLLKKKYIILTKDDSLK